MRTLVSGGPATLWDCVLIVWPLPAYVFYLFGRFLALLVVSFWLVVVADCFADETPGMIPFFRGL